MYTYVCVIYTHIYLFILWPDFGFWSVHKNNHQHSVESWWGCLRDPLQSQAWPWGPETVGVQARASPIRNFHHDGVNWVVKPSWSCSCTELRMGQQLPSCRLLIVYGGYTWWSLSSRGKVKEALPLLPFPMRGGISSMLQRRSHDQSDIWWSCLPIFLACKILTLSSYAFSTASSTLRNVIWEHCSPRWFYRAETTNNSSPKRTSTARTI